MDTDFHGDVSRAGQEMSRAVLDQNSVGSSHQHFPSCLNMPLLAIALTFFYLNDNADDTTRARRII